MNRTIHYTITASNIAATPFPETGRSVFKISDYLRFLGYPSAILTKLRHTPEAILKNGLPVYMNQTLAFGDVLTVQVKEENATVSAIVPVVLPFPIVYEDEDLVVINKPAGMAIHPSIRHHDNTLANAACYHYRAEASPFVYRCINRLDKDTTGLTILAKNPLSGSILQQQMRERKIHRVYTAIVEGYLSKESDTISLPIARKEASIIERVVDPVGGEPAVTHYRVLRQIDGPIPLSLVECELETGRTHQIRVHMSAIGHPLVGDYLYNPRFVDNGEAKHPSRQLLHAGFISFTHPITGLPLHLNANMPEDMENYLSP